MIFDKINQNGLVLLGCGKMGSAMLAGWLENGLTSEAVYVIDPSPSEWLKRTGVHINAPLPSHPVIAIIAVKPQMMGSALPELQALPSNTVFLSIAAGTSLATFEKSFKNSPIVRAMPNTPSAIGKGITAIIGNAAVTPEHLDLSETLLRAVGAVVRLETEEQIDAVTGLSGSGPAYVFHMIETLAKAGEANGLPTDLAMQLAKATVAGSGALAIEAEETPEQLRINVTSPNGTTQAGLEVLMDPETGLPPLILSTVSAATQRARALK